MHIFVNITVICSTLKIKCQFYFTLSLCVLDELKIKFLIINQNITAFSHRQRHCALKLVNIKVMQYFTAESLQNIILVCLVLDIFILEFLLVLFYQDNLKSCCNLQVVCFFYCNTSLKKIEYSMLCASALICFSVHRKNLWKKVSVSKSILQKNITYWSIQLGVLSAIRSFTRRLENCRLE